MLFRHAALKFPLIKTYYIEILSFIMSHPGWELFNDEQAHVLGLPFKEAVYHYVRMSLAKRALLLTKDKFFVRAFSEKTVALFLFLESVEYLTKVQNDYFSVIMLWSLSERILSGVKEELGSMHTLSNDYLYLE